jgi:Mn2+/Fe2+ NRAMP family transporter
LLLINRRDLMGEYVNSMAFNIIAWASSIIMIILTFILVYTSIFQPSSAGISGALIHWPHWLRL